MNIWRHLIVVLVLISITIWYSVAQFPDNYLHITACDVGQGDAFLITYGTAQIVVDGGPNRRILDCLSHHMPFWDREIEVVILTHPQADHYTGLIELTSRYRVGYFIKPGVDTDSDSYLVLKESIDRNEVEVIEINNQAFLNIDQIFIEILNPIKGFDQENSFTENQDVNNLSIVFNLFFRDFNALFTGDVDSNILEEIIEREKISGVEYIKVPHHGSKYGLNSEIISSLNPGYAVISAGNNPWGHPNQEVLDLLRSNDIEYSRTDKDGDIEIVTNGFDWWIR
jgi:competence protein ComEC